MKIRNILDKIFKTIGYKIEILRLSKSRSEDRFSYQSKYFDFDNILKNKPVILDVGSGNDPFPYATILPDKFMEITEHRAAELVKDERPFLIFDVEYIPFADKAIDFLYCSHLLEHVNNPEKACREIQRVAKSGYIETPNFMKDILFGWAKGMHKWHTIFKDNTLYFFEYTDRELEGLRSSAWSDVIFSPYETPLKKAFYDNQDLFNTMFIWNDQFNVKVISNGPKNT
jgi:SAM-dependent methyltransferase